MTDLQRRWMCLFPQFLQVKKTVLILPVKKVNWSKPTLVQVCSVPPEQHSPGQSLSSQPGEQEEQVPVCLQKARETEKRL